ncbi:MAG: hypothetical protein AB7K09_06860 [Planctomycetota bacterium]
MSDDNAPGPDAIEPQRERLLFIHDAAAPDVPTSGDVYLWHDCDRDSAWIEVVPVPASGLPVARLDLQAIPFGRTRAGGIFIVSWHLIEGDAAEVATPPDIHVVGAPPGVGYFSPALLDPDRRATVARWCAPWHGYIEATYQGEPRVATLHARMPWYRAPDDDEDGRFVRRIDALGLPEWLEAPLSAGPTPIVALCMAWEDQPPSHPLDNIEADYDRWWFTEARIVTPDGALGADIDLRGYGNTEQTATFELGPGALASLMLLDQFGDPVADRWIDVTLPGSSGERRSDSGGRLDLGYLPAGTHTLTLCLTSHYLIFDSNYRQYTDEVDLRIDITAGRQFDLAVPVQRRAAMRLWIDDPSGLIDQYVPTSVHIQLLDAADNRDDYLGTTVADWTPRAPGAFVRIGFVPFGAFNLQVVNLCHGTQTFGPYQFEPGRSPIDLRIALAPPAGTSLKVRVTPADLAKGRQWRAYDAAAAEPYEFDGYSDVEYFPRAIADGRVPRDGLVQVQLPEGKYRFVLLNETATSWRGETMMSPAVAMLDVAGGVTTEAELQLTPAAVLEFPAGPRLLPLRIVDSSGHVHEVWRNEKAVRVAVAPGHVRVVMLVGRPMSATDDPNEISPVVFEGDVSAGDVRAVPRPATRYYRLRGLPPLAHDNEVERSWRDSRGDHVVLEQEWNGEWHNLGRRELFVEAMLGSLPAGRYRVTVHDGRRHDHPQTILSLPEDGKEDESGVVFWPADE